MTDTNEVTKTVKEELDIFIPPETIKLSNGRTIPFPKLIWKVEKQMLDHIGAILEEVTELADFDFAEATMTEMVKIAGKVMRRVPNRVTALVSLAVNMTEEEVENQLDSGDIVNILFPLFQERMRNLGSRLGTPTQ